MKLRGGTALVARLSAEGYQERKDRHFHSLKPFDRLTSCAFWLLLPFFCFFLIQY